MEDGRCFRKVKIVFVDIDGTLTNSNREITEYTKSVIDKAVRSGIYVVITSGRTPAYVVDKSKKANASNIVICNNGATVYDYENDKKIYDGVFDRKLLKKILDFANKCEVSCTLNSTYKRYRIHKEYSKYISDAIVINNINDIDDTISQIVIDGKKYKDIEKIINFVNSMEELEISNMSDNIQNKDVDSEEGYWMDIVLKGNNKGNAIANLLNILNIDKENAICFGDEMNDYPMFKACGIKVAMGNAIDELKEKADYVTVSNNEDGVAKFIDENILLEEKLTNV